MHNPRAIKDRVPRLIVGVLAKNKWFLPGEKKSRPHGERSGLMFFSKIVCVKTFLSFVKHCNCLRVKKLGDLWDACCKGENGCQLATTEGMENRRITADLVMRVWSKKTWRIRYEDPFC